MKNFIAFIAIITFVTSVSAENWRDPESRFDATKSFTTVSTIRWQITDNVQKTCEAESKRRGLGGFGFGVDACSFWEGSSCVIITGRLTTMHEIGHEMRHCFQGAFH